jgi:hypothetical protein
MVKIYPSHMEEIHCSDNKYELLSCKYNIWGNIQNIPDWCCHVYSSWSSAKRRLPCLVSQCAKLHVAGWTWAVFTRVYMESCISLLPQSGNFCIHPCIKHKLLLLLPVSKPAIINSRNDQKCTQLGSTTHGTIFHS